MDDEVAFAEVEERIDRLAESAAGQAAQFAAMEELAGRENQRARIAAAQAKAGVEGANGKMETAGSGQLGQRKDFAEALDLGFSRGDDKYVVAVGNGIELVEDASDVAAKALDRLQRQVAMHAGGAGLNFGGRGDGEMAAFSEN